MTQRKTSTKVRCVPRFGYDYADVREIEVDVENAHDDVELRTAVDKWFAHIGIAEALFDLDVDDDGYFAVVNDEAYQRNWGQPLF